MQRKEKQSSRNIKGYSLASRFAQVDDAGYMSEK